MTVRRTTDPFTLGELQDAMIELERRYDDDRASFRERVLGSDDTGPLRSGRRWADYIAEIIEEQRARTTFTPVDGGVHHSKN